MGYLLGHRPGDVGNDAPGLPFELAVREAEDGVARGAEIELPRVVVLPGDRTAVVAPAVEAEAAVPDGVDAAVDAVEMAAGNPVAYRPCSQASAL